MSVWGKLRGKADRVREAMMEYAYLITLGTVVAVIAASAMYANSVRTQFEERTDTPVEAAAEAEQSQKKLNQLKNLRLLKDIKNKVFYQMKK